MENEKAGTNVAGKVVSEVLKEGEQVNKSAAETPGKAVGAVTAPVRKKAADKVAKMAEEKIRDVVDKKKGKEGPDADKNAPLGKRDGGTPVGPEEEKITVSKKELEEMIDKAVSEKLKDLPKEIKEGIDKAVDRRIQAITETGKKSIENIEKTGQKVMDGINEKIDQAQKTFNDAVDRLQGQAPSDRTKQPGQSLPGPERLEINEEAEKKILRSLTPEQRDKLRELLDKAEGQKLPDAAGQAKGNITGKLKEKGQDAAKDKAKEVAGEAAKKTAEKGVDVAVGASTAGVYNAVKAGVKVGAEAAKVVVKVGKDAGEKGLAGPGTKAVEAVKEKTQKKEGQDQENPFKSAADTVKGAQNAAKNLGLTK